MTASNLAAILVECLDLDVVDDLPVKEARLERVSNDDCEAVVALDLRSGKRFEITVRDLTPDCHPDDDGVMDPRD